MSTTALGIDDPTPLLTWKISSTVPGDQQTAYEVQVGTALGASDVVATGKVSSVAQEYEVTAPLKSATGYYARVRVWDSTDTVSAWQQLALETGLWSLADWKGAQWIGRTGTAAPQLRKEFTTTKAVRSARLYLAAGGYAEAHVNNTQVTDPLAPGFTNYTKRVQYIVKDISAQIVPNGANAIAVTLGRGFFGCTTVTDWGWATAPWFGDPRLLALIRIVYTDGTTMTVVSDTTWSTIGGPTTADSIYLGETYDARLETPGWRSSGFTATGWTTATALAGPKGGLTAQHQQPIRAGAAINPTSTTNPTSGGTRYTFPKVMTGWAQIQITAPAGTQVTITYSEKINTDGSPYTTNTAVTGTCQQDTFISAGGTQVWAPRFSYTGFQYVDVVGVVPDSVVAIPAWTDYAQTGNWTSSDSTLNQLHAMAAQTVHINSHGIPTDTPTYERNGWLGDSNVMADSAMHMWDIGPLYRKWLDDIDDDYSPTTAYQLHNIVPSAGYGTSPSIAWASAYLLVTHRVWKWTGDLQLIAQHFDRMKQFVDSYLTNPVPTSWAASEYYGDWGSVAGNLNDGGHDIVGAACVIRSTRALADFCDALGRTDGQTYRNIATDIATTVGARLRQNDGSYLPANDWAGGMQQTPTVLAVKYGLTTGTAAATSVATLENNVRVTKNYHSSCGIIGEPDLLPVLTENGYIDTAYQVAKQTSFPSWGQWAASGGTTLWNSFTADPLGTRSLSHQMHGNFVAWLYRYLGGINLTGPTAITIAPYIPTGLTSVTASIETIRGTVTTNRTGKNLTVTIPPGITASYNGTVLASGTTTITLP